jgi:hypothetical protein
MLLVGSGVAQALHLRTDRDELRRHSHHAEQSRSDSTHREHDESSCDICIDLALAGSAPATPDAPVFLVGNVFVQLVGSDDELAPSLDPPACVAGRPPPTFA